MLGYCRASVLAIVSFLFGPPSASSARLDMLATNLYRAMIFKKRITSMMLSLVSTCLVPVEGNKKLMKRANKKHEEEMIT